MNRTQKVAIGASALVVAGLVALAVVPALSGAMSLAAEQPATADTPPDESPAPVAVADADADADEDAAGVAAVPVEAAEYRERFYTGLGYGEGRVLTLDEVRKEYTAAAAAFPYPLPEGWEFPADPGYYDDPRTGPNWNAVLNLTRVFEYWAYANATDAIAAYEAGDTAEFERLMDVLRDGYVGALPPNYDPQDGRQWFDNVYRGYENGDFSRFATSNFNPFPYEYGG